MVEEPDFARFHFPLEIAQRNIAPHIAVEINQNGVDVRDGLEKFRHIIMRLDLDGVGVEREPQAALYDKAWQCASQSTSG